MNPANGRIFKYMKRKNMRHNIDEMKTIAKDRGGLCLSDKYANVQTKLKWQCSKGHIWEAIPKNIKRGSWCGKWPGDRPC